MTEIKAFSMQMLDIAGGNGNQGDGSYQKTTGNAAAISQTLANNQLQLISLQAFLHQTLLMMIFHLPLILAGLFNFLIVLRPY